MAHSSSRARSTRTWPSCGASSRTTLPIRATASRCGKWDTASWPERALTQPSQLLHGMSNLSAPRGGKLWELLRPATGEPQPVFRSSQLAARSSLSSPGGPVLFSLAVVLALATPNASAPDSAAWPASMVVSADWLAKHRDDRGLVILHVGDRKTYEREHIPGARYISFDDVA